MDRKPKPAPFPIGTRLRYIGKHESYTYDIRDGEKKTIPLCVPGMEVTIDSIMAGHRGTLRHLRDEDGPMYYEDTGEPVLDKTQDDLSVYHVEAYQNGRKQGRCIHCENVSEWEIVK